MMPFKSNYWIIFDIDFSTIEFIKTSEIEKFPTINKIIILLICLFGSQLELRYLS